MNKRLIYVVLLLLAILGCLKMNSAYADTLTVKYNPMGFNSPDRGKVITKTLNDVNGYIVFPVQWEYPTDKIIKVTINMGDGTSFIIKTYQNTFKAEFK
jgi:hypothetical protein